MFYCVLSVPLDCGWQNLQSLSDDIGGFVMVHVNDFMVTDLFSIEKICVFEESAKVKGNFLSGHWIIEIFDLESRLEALINYSQFNAM